MRTLIAAVLLVAGASSCASPAPPETADASQASHVIEGAFTLFDPDGIYINRGPDGINHCTGTGGYGDIKPGLQVVVRDGDGTVLGTGRLAYDDDAYRATDRECTLVFKVQVPEAEFYSLAVGDRGELTYSRAEMEALGWRVAAELGG